MEIKYDPVFGDQALFDGAPEDAEAVGGGKPLQDALVFYKFSDGEFQYKYEAEIDDWKVSTCKHPQSVIKAMRRIIRTPIWTVEDQQAGRLPEVGAKIDGGTVVFVNSFNIVVELDSGAVIVSSHKTFLAVHKPIETDAERQQRLREEWVDSAITETEKRKDTTTDEYERLKARVKDIYDALLTGELPVPIKGE